MNSYTPVYYIMLMVIQSLLRLREDVKENKTWRHWTPVLDRLVERKCDHDLCFFGECHKEEGAYWVPVRELKILVDRGFAKVDTQTSLVEPTAKFDMLAEALFETQVERTDLFEGWNFLGNDDVNVVDETQVDSYDLDFYNHRFFETDESGSVQLRSKLIELDPCDDWN